MKDKHGIYQLTSDPDNYWLRLEAKKEGCNSANCPPLCKSTSYPRKKETGATFGKYREIWPIVK